MRNLSATHNYTPKRGLQIDDYQKYTRDGVCAPVENFGKTKSRCQNSVEVVFQIGGASRKNWFRITQPIPMRVQGTHV